LIRSVLAEVAGQELAWVQPKVGKPEYELRAAGTVVASLRGRRGESDHHEWTFKLQGWFRRRVAVYTPDSDAAVAVFRWRRAEGGTMELPDGRPLHFGPAKNSSPPRWDWLEPDGTPLVHFQTRPGFDLSEGLVEIEQEAAHISELTLLVLLGEYLAVLFAARYYGGSGWSDWDPIDLNGPAFPDLSDLPGLPDFD
jgi:hypothetical protein